MITPENQIPLDDENAAEADDQQSQKDIHSNGFDDEPEDGDIIDEADPAKLKQAYDAAESSYTLDFGEEDDE